MAETHLIVNDKPAGTIDSDGHVTLQDFFVYRKGGVLALSVGIHFDLAVVDPDSRLWVVEMILTRRMHLHGMTDEDMERSARQNKRYQERKAEFAALPWYKRMFTRRPWAADPENGD